MIGVFDSGLGGLTVLKEFKKTCPDYNYIYLGDNARVPYGSKSQDLIYQYTIEAVEFLFSKGCNLVILACNSASSMALRRLQQEWLPVHYPDRRVLGVIRPIAETVVECDFRRVGVIGTKATIKSNVYKKEIEKLNVKNHKLMIFQNPAPLLVPLVEEVYNNDKVIDAIIGEYLDPLKAEKIDYLILGCTHYPLLIDNIKRLIGEKCIVENPASIVAKKLKNYLDRHPELMKVGSSITGTKSMEILVYTTDDAERFRENGEMILGEKLKEVKKIVLSFS